MNETFFLLIMLLAAFESSYEGVEPGNQNLNRWKEKNGNSYDAFLKYREDAIKRAYDGGIKMCEQYANNTTLEL